MTGRYGKIDYPKFAKGGFALGVAMLVVGALVQFGSHAFFGPLPGWESQLFLDIEFLGLLIALLAPLFFGIILPLTE
ncbi:hypothetical protein ACFQE1_21640 [Halobium palmae]|uniref:Uncharacterized protein n=1 Tax=Halobium palmae TaxID=1776492 RepID=A0ABD5S5T0_9EURY